MVVSCIFVSFDAETKRDLDVFKKWLEDKDFTVQSYPQNDDLHTWIIGRNRNTSNRSAEITIDQVKLMLNQANDYHKDLHRMIETIKEVDTPLKIKWSFGKLWSVASNCDFETYVSYELQPKTLEPKNVVLNGFQATDADDVIIEKDYLNNWQIWLTNKDGDETHQINFVIGDHGENSCILESTGDVEEYDEILFHEFSELDAFPEMKEVALQFIQELM
jgi:hypothetical protein